MTVFLHYIKVNAHAYFVIFHKHTWALLIISVFYCLSFLRQLTGMQPVISRFPSL